jgi:YHS domain-containing protein
MKVDRAKALTAEHGGRTHWFCSAQCRDEFVSG